MNKVLVAVACCGLPLFVGGGLVGCEPENGANDPDVTDDDSDDGACVASALDAEQRLTLGLTGFVNLAVGQVFTPTVGYEECCSFFTPLPDACVAFSFTSDATGIATLDPVTGVVRVDPAAPDNSTLGVRASVDDGAYNAALSLHIYDPVENPFVGAWRHMATLDCDSGAEIEPGSAIDEVRFLGNRSVWVTHIAFESYVDYRADAGWDVELGTFSFVASPINSLPDDVDGEDGSFEFDADGRLILRDLWLGTFSDDMVTGCGLVLER